MVSHPTCPRVTVFLPFSQIKAFDSQERLRKGSRQSFVSLLHYCFFPSSRSVPQWMLSQGSFYYLLCLVRFLVKEPARRCRLPQFIRALMPSHCCTGCHSAFTCSLTILAVFVWCPVASVSSKHVLTSPLSLQVPASLLMQGQLFAL